MHGFSCLKTTLSRREFLKNIFIAGGMITLNTTSELSPSFAASKYTKDPSCTLYRALNGSPEDNLIKVISSMAPFDYSNHTCDNCFRICQNGGANIDQIHTKLNFKKILKV